MTVPAALIFDLDGTLLDTLQDIAESANSALDHLGLPTHSMASYRHFVGDGVHLLIRRILPETADDHIQQRCLELFFSFYKEGWQRHCRPYPGIVETIGRLHQAGLKMAILSNKPQPFTLRFAEKFLPIDTFFPVYGQRPEVARKPDPAAALTIAAELGEKPGNMFFIGDTPIDIETGKRAGMKTVAVTWGFRPLEELASLSPDILINHPRELEPHVLCPS
jgi:phosphoglycolate phosphatase